MSALAAAQAYFDAWNDRDADAVLSSLHAEGSYEDPLTPGPIADAAFKVYMDSLWAAFPDLAFDIASVAETGGGRVAAEWIMRGTNSGSFNGLPPTGIAIESRGSDFIETRDGKVSRVVGYFDPGSIPRQLGLQVVVQPKEIGPFRFGTAAAVPTGRRDKPGAFSVTQLDARDEDAAQAVADLSRQTLVEMMEAPGFIGALTGRIGTRMVTLTAWDDAEAPARFMSQGTHGEAMKSFFDGTLASGGYTSVWSPVRINPMWVRCEACGTMSDSEKAEGNCGCGVTLPEPSPYW